MDFEPITTKYGTIWILVHNMGEVFVTNNPNSNPVPMHVNNVELQSVSAHMFRFKDDKFHIGQEKSLPFERLYHHLHITRNWAGPAPTTSQRNRIAAELDKVVNEWILANPMKLREAHTKHLWKEYEKQVEKVKTMSAALETEVQNMETMNQTYINFTNDTATLNLRNNQ